LLEKYKEKNASVGKAIGEALTVMHKHCWALADVGEQLTGVCTLYGCGGGCGCWWWL
jgi:hypothetical protein